MMPDCPHLDSDIKLDEGFVGRPSHLYYDCKTLVLRNTLNRLKHVECILVNNFLYIFD